MEDVKFHWCVCVCVCACVRACVCVRQGVYVMCVDSCVFCMSLYIIFQKKESEDHNVLQIAQFQSNYYCTFINDIHFYIIKLNAIIKVVSHSL